ncbi:MAG: hypothetical protein HQK84_00345 [Nitrospinae bacterium]|nr:hypothetical protein [Nitrospinota bacterium]
MTDIDLIQSINRAIKKEFPDLKGTYFIGSRMKGKAVHQYTDYDFVFALGHKPDWREKNKLYDILAVFEVKEDIVIDGKAYDEKELKNVWTPFRNSVLNEGVFYAAG